MTLLIARALAYRRAYSRSWFGIAMPRLRRGLYERAARDLAPRLPDRARVLDVGTGPGHMLAAIARSAPPAEIHGLDIDPAMVEEARRRVSSTDAAENITVDLGTAAALPYPDAHFDAVVSLMSYHLWDEPMQSLIEIHRVLRRRGVMHLYVGRTQAYPGRWPALDYFNRRSQQTLRTALLTAGFEAVNIQYPGRIGTYLLASATA